MTTNKRLEFLRPRHFLASSSLFFILVLVLAGWATPKAFAQNQTMGLTALIEEAFQKNPELMAKKKEYEAKQSAVISAWLLEDPEFGLDVEAQPEIFDFDQRMNNEFMLQQKIPFPTKILFRGLAAAKEAQIAYQAYREKERQLVWQITEPYHRLFLAKKMAGLLEENKGLLEQTLKSVSSLYESGRARQEDILKSQIELSKLEIELFNARQEQELQMAEFSSLLSRPFHEALAPEEFKTREKLNFSLEELEQLSLKHRPELKMFILQNEQAGLNQASAHHAWLPDIALRYEGRQFPGDKDIQEHDTFIGLSVPVWSLLKGIGGGWASADAEAKAANAVLENARNELLLDVRQAYSMLKRAENALVIYETNILPQAKQQMEVTFTAYEAQKSDFLAVVDAQKTYRESQIAYATAWADYEIALAELSACCGLELK